MARDPERLRAILDSTLDLPTLPSVALRVGEMVRDPNVSAAEVAAVLSEDQALTAKILKLVNSAFYGFPQKIQSVSRAIVILGFNRIRNLTLTISVVDRMSPAHARFPATPFWEHSLATAVAGDAVARVLRLVPEQENAFVAGLLHDIGKLACMHALAPEFEEVLREVEASDSLMVDAEKKVLGVTHAQIGEWLCRRWNFPPALTQAVRLHHDPELAREHRKLVMVVHLADVLVRSLGIGSGGDRRVPRLHEEVWHDLRLTLPLIDRCLQETLDGVEKGRDFFQVIKTA